jgi:hypothetical protein
MMAEWKPGTINLPISRARIEILSPIKQDGFITVYSVRHGTKPIRFHHIPMIAEVRILTQGESN